MKAFNWLNFFSWNTEFKFCYESLCNYWENRTYIRTNTETPFCDMSPRKPFTSLFGQSTEVSVEFNIFRVKVLQRQNNYEKGTTKQQRNSYSYYYYWDWCHLLVDLMTVLLLNSHYWTAIKHLMHQLFSLTEDDRKESKIRSDDW